MDKVLDKLGIYDLFVNLIAGIAMLSAFCFLSSNLYRWNITDLLQKMNVWTALVLAYFIGIVFQELSNCFETTLYRIERRFSHNKRFRFTFILWFIPSLDRVLIFHEKIIFDLMQDCYDGVKRVLIKDIKANMTTDYPSNGLSDVFIGNVRDINGKPFSSADTVFTIDVVSEEED